MGRRVPASRETSERIEELVNEFEAHREGPSFQQLGLRKLIEELLEEVSVGPLQPPPTWLAGPVWSGAQCGTLRDLAPEEGLRGL